MCALLVDKRDHHVGAMGWMVAVVRLLALMGDFNTMLQCVLALLTPKHTILKTNHHAFHDYNNHGDDNVQ